MKTIYTVGLKSGKLAIFKNYKFAVLILQDIELANFAVHKLNTNQWNESHVSDLMRMNIADAANSIGIWNK